MKQSFIRENEASSLTLQSVVLRWLAVLIDALHFAHVVLEQKSLVGPAPISGGNPSQDSLMPSLHSTSPRCLVYFLKFLVDSSLAVMHGSRDIKKSN